MSETLQGQTGIDARRVTAWLQENIADVVAPFTFRLITGGRSNLTFEVLDANGRERRRIKTLRIVTPQFSGIGARVEDRIARIAQGSRQG